LTISHWKSLTWRCRQRGRLRFAFAAVGVEQGRDETALVDQFFRSNEAGG
jgi:hypothetical protein